MFSSCVFGNSELMAYKGTSTKVHVVPSDPRAADYSASAFGDGRSSVGRSSARSSKLSQSFSSQTISPTNHPSLSTPAAAPRFSDRKKVLITRLFPVNISNDDPDISSPQSRFSDDNNGFPFPATSDDLSLKKKKPQPKQRRTPMYAVVLVVQLPPSYARVSSAALQKSAMREPGSYNDNEFMPSSFSSARFSGFTAMGSGTYGEGTDSSYSIDGDDKIDALTQHWDIIMRTLTHLQSTVASTLNLMLKQVDVASPGPLPLSSSSAGMTRPVSFSEGRSGDPQRLKPPKGTTKLVSLWPNCLAEDAAVSKEVEAARSRIVRGLRASRVVTGQGRWGIWRDEMIWSSKWTASVDQEQFLGSLLTGFLATHTDWLQALAPSSYRRRMLLRRQGRNEEDLCLPARTILVCDDKMAARRLIFLLTAFLPASQQLLTTRAHRPSTSMSFGLFSNSPPSQIAPFLREESLRRRMNRRTGARRTSHSRTASQGGKGGTVPVQLAHLSAERTFDRRASDAASIRTANLPISGNDAISRKSSAATTTTIVPEPALPHFSTVKRADSRRKPRPGSSGSVATDDLKRSLQRVESSGQASTTSNDARNPGLKWGSFIGGLWTPRRRESIEQVSDIPDGGLRSPVRPAFGQKDKLFDIVREVPVVEEGEPSSSHNQLDDIGPRDLRTPRDHVPHGRPSFTQSDRTSDPNGAFESPVKTSINADDGVIDVDVPFPDYVMSFESAFSSPSSSGYLSTPGFMSGVDSFEQSGRLAVDGDLPQNAAGWLDQYHPDFSLQAIPPQEDLVEKVKASLRAEPTPVSVFSAGKDSSERWVDVGSAVIADAKIGSVTRIMYRRLVKPRVSAERSGHGSSSLPNFYGGGLLTPSILPYDAPLEEEWIEEPVSCPDDILADTLDKVINFNLDVSKDNSSASSQVHIDTQPMEAEPTPEHARVAAPSLEIPRTQCKTAVLSALEEIIRDVIDKRDDYNAGSREKSTSDRYLHNVLRQAIRDWAAAAESGE